MGWRHNMLQQPCEILATDAAVAIAVVQSEQQSGLIVHRRALVKGARAKTAPRKSTVAHVRPGRFKAPANRDRN
eukprot:CAMPEP_0170449010 /NCGR_PEP_ID=MMETSP0117_2-20130122/51018_1 /TAXON_ID=400756 /ORGANISM="Durinskia baltica, Strain CSIRO CS-38" /LENGTH=73 /DNA_ID=CAMNT_0010710227 /DNA_START=374 /DNA_END=593 /DNA_ORIENTATION=+